MFIKINTVNQNSVKIKLGTQTIIIFTITSEKIKSPLNI